MPSATDVRLDVPILLVHGGAGTIRQPRRAAYRAGLARALDLGWPMLERGGTAVDAVLAAVESMELDPYAFNAGVGGAPTREGRVECDAGVATWAPGPPPSIRAGAVGALSGCRTPSRAADAVRRRSDHVLVVGAAAEAWIPDGAACEPEALLTDAMRARLDRWRAAHEHDASLPPAGTATVGAVARDASGQLAAVTSTGGLLGQVPGRVGDSPIIGAGTLADDGVAVSCTGYGEAFLLRSTARRLADALNAGVDGEEAVAGRLADLEPVGGRGGLICATADGRAFVGFSSPHMAWGVRSAGALESIGLETSGPGGGSGVDLEPRILRLA